jgi:hypothetical protein
MRIAGSKASGCLFAEMEVCSMSNWRFILLTISLHLPVITNAAAPPTRIDSSKVSQLLRQLDDDEFDVRQTADFRKSAMGKPVIPYLREEQSRHTIAGSA